VCFPHAGGGATFFREWPQLLPSTIEVQAVRYPGREDRLSQPAIDEMPVLADEAAAAIAHLGDRPLALFGHSMGGAVAFEVALRLERAEVAVLDHVFISSSRVADGQGTRHLGDDDALWRELSRLNGTSDLVLGHSELRALVLPYLRSDYRLIERYRPAETDSLAAPLTAFVGDRDPDVAVSDAHEWRWRTRGRFAVSVFEGGDHFYLVPRRTELLRRVAAELAGPARGEGRWPSTP
jgi:pyochelin biosynthetic protein PchC